MPTPPLRSCPCPQLTLDISLRGSSSGAPCSRILPTPHGGRGSCEMRLRRTAPSLDPEPVHPGRGRGTCHEELPWGLSPPWTGSQGASPGSTPAHLLSLPLLPCPPGAQSARSACGHCMKDCKNERMKQYVQCAGTAAEGLGSSSAHSSLWGLE